jgi:hypothetical protein
MMKLTGAKFTPPVVANGHLVDIEFKWKSTDECTVYLNYNADEFEVSPSSFDLPAKPGGATEPRGVQITRKGTLSHCEVRFVFGISDKLAAVEVV